MTTLRIVALLLLVNTAVFVLSVPRGGGAGVAPLGRRRRGGAGVLGAAYPADEADGRLRRPQLTGIALGGCGAYEGLRKCGFEELDASSDGCLRGYGLSMCCVARGCAPRTRGNGRRLGLGRPDCRCDGHRGELVSANTFWRSLEAKRRLQDHYGRRGALLCFRDEGAILLGSPS